jgi:hypothetical protein
VLADDGFSSGNSHCVPGDAQSSSPLGAVASTYVARATLDCDKRTFSVAVRSVSASGEESAEKVVPVSSSLPESPQAGGGAGALYPAIFVGPAFRGHISVKSVGAPVSEGGITLSLDECGVGAQQSVHAMASADFVVQKLNLQVSVHPLRVAQNAYEHIVWLQKAKTLAAETGQPVMRCLKVLTAGSGDGAGPGSTVLSPFDSAALQLLQNNDDESGRPGKPSESGLSCDPASVLSPAMMAVVRLLAGR